MSYLHEIFHAVRCDRCGETHEGEYEYYTDEQGAWESAEGDDWIEVDGKHYCPCCYHEENDENVPLKPLPPIYWTARAACRKLGTLPSIEFLDDGIKVTSALVTKEKMVEGVIDWILRQHNNGKYGVYTAECKNEHRLYASYRLEVTINL